MKSEEKLEHLFELLRSEESTTGLSDVTSWIKASALNTDPISSTKSIIKQKLFIMISAATIILTGVLIMSGNKKPKMVSEQKAARQNIIVNAPKMSTVQSNHLPPVNNSNSKKPIDPPLVASDSVTLPIVEIAPAPETTQIDSIATTQNSTVTTNKSNTGSWFSSNNILYVDTLFNGVKSLVFKGDKSDIVVHGSDRIDISMNYNYRLRAKGVFSGKKEGNCELGYMLRDSVLTIHLQRKDQKFKGISVLSETSKIEFKVPKNIDVKMDSDLGDIDVDGLRNTGTFLYSSLGDITAANSTGEIDIETALGDISMKNVTGKLKLITSLGDISGENITVSDDCQLNSSLGGIDVQVNNPISECRLDLSTNLGKVKVKRADLKTKSEKKLRTGSGTFKLIMNTSMGNIIVR